MAHHVDPLADLQCDRKFLLDQKDGHAASRDLLEQCADPRGHLGRKALGRFVHHDQVRVAHQRPANRQHLLLTARKHRGFHIGTFRQVLEKGEHVRHGPAALPVLLAGLQAENEILPGGQPRKDVAILGNVANPKSGDLERLAPGDLRTPERDRTLRGHIAHDRFAGGRAPDPIAAQQSDNLALAHTHVHTLQDVGLAIIGVEVANFEHQ